MRATTPRFSGKKIVELRNRAGITQAELARRANVHVAQLSRWENGKKPRADVVGVLAAALACDVSAFFVDGDARETGDEDEESDLLAAAYALERFGDYAMADRLRARAREAARARSLA